MKKIRLFIVFIVLCLNMVGASMAESLPSEAAYEPGDIITFGTYPQGAGGEVEPIEWLVLEVRDGKALLISRYGLDAKAYHTEYVQVTWETCSLRAWLNDDFLNTAFTLDEQAAIILTDVDNSASECFNGYSKNAGNDTQDKLFLLSYAEAYKYFNVTWDDTKNVAARVAPTAYAIEQGAEVGLSYLTEEGNAAGWWWLRSPGGNQRIAAIVRTSGTITSSCVDISFEVVRPALWVDLENDAF